MIGFRMNKRNLAFLLPLQEFRYRGFYKPNLHPLDKKMHPLK